MHRSQRLLLKPNNKQLSLFAGSAGLSRFAWNWALALCQRHYRMFGKKEGYKRPLAYTLMNHWNKVKDRRFTWVRQYSKFIPEESFKNLDHAYQMVFKRLKKGKKPGFPKFHKRGRNDSFNVIPSNHFPLKTVGCRVRIPRIGMVRIENDLLWSGAKQVYGQVKYRAGRWWLTISYELRDPTPLPANRPTCGIDLGCTTFATIASGKLVESVPPPKPYAKAKRRLKRLGRAVSRKFRKCAPQSNRYKKAKLRLSKMHERIGNIRSDFLHQLTRRIVNTFGTVVLEDLNVAGMGRGFLSGTIQDLGFAEFRRQIEYKSEATGTKVVFADRFFPSSKTCCECGLVRDSLPLNERMLWCPCGSIIDRDENAARNLEKLPQGMGKVTRGESGDHSDGQKPKRSAARRTANALSLNTSE